MKKTLYLVILSVCLAAFGPALKDSACAGVDLNKLVVETASITSFKGSWHEIGKQIGKTYPEYIIDFGNTMKIVLIFAGPGHGWTPQTYYEEIKDTIPQSIQDHMEGMAEGLSEVRPMSPGTAWDIVLTQNMAIELINMNSNMSDIPSPAAEKVRGCTALAVSSPAGTFLCHNTDANVSGDNINVIMYWEPTDGGDYACITIDPPGWADVSMGINEKGIGVTLNAGGVHEDARIGMPVNFMLRSVIEHAATLEEAVGAFTGYVESGKFFGPSGEILQIMDLNTGAMAKLEVHSTFVNVIDAVASPYGVNYIASTNHFIGENVDESSSSFMRYSRLLELVNQTKSFDLNACWNVLSDTSGSKASNTTISRVGQENSVATNYGVIFTADGLYYTMGPPHAYRATFGDPPFVSFSRLANSPVASFIALPGSRRITLSWEPAPGADITGLYLHRADRQAGTYDIINTAPLQPADRQFEDTGLKNKNRYYYKLEVRHGDGTSTMYGPINATPKLRYAFVPAGKQ